jgi:hypothetical protein
MKAPKAAARTASSTSASSSTYSSQSARFDHNCRPPLEYRASFLKIEGIVNIEATLEIFKDEYCNIESDLRGASSAARRNFQGFSYLLFAPFYFPRSGSPP